jgi:asparagine synthase (glutamine-hydrolysing)
MNHFIALACVRMRPTRTAAAIAIRNTERFSATHWQEQHDGDNLWILSSRVRSACFSSYVLPNHGVVVGTLFSHDFTRISVDYFETNAQQLHFAVRTAGRHIVDTLWGRYVAFISADSHTVSITRDPTGGLPCFFYESDGLMFFFSDMEDFAALAPARLTLNRGLISSFLKYGSRASAATGFDQIQVLRPGERALLRSEGSTRDFLWNPKSICDAGSIEDVERARAAVRHTTMGAVRAWGSCYDRIVHQLSGGLDSSLVLACLTEYPGPSMVALNYYSDIREGDERAFARLAATGRCELVEEAFRASALPLVDMLKVQPLPTPSLATWKSQLSVCLDALVNARGAQAVFTGQGGDHLFQRRRSALIPAEFLYRHGMTVPAMRLFADTAQMMNTPFWYVLVGAIWHGLFVRSRAPSLAIPAPSFLSREANSIATHEDAAHPWQQNARGLPSAKRQQIFDLIDCQRFYFPTDESIDVIHPLISQPIIECCLKIPTYVLTNGGRERGLVRSAFSDLLPSEIAWRNSKGAATAYYYEIIAENLEFARDFLLDGTLMQMGFLDKRALETALSVERIVFGAEIAALHNTLLTEAWLRASVDLRSPGNA